MIHSNINQEIINYVIKNKRNYELLYKITTKNVINCRDKFFVLVTVFHMINKFFMIGSIVVRVFWKKTITILYIFMVVNYYYMYF